MSKKIFSLLILIPLFISCAAGTSNKDIISKCRDNTDCLIEYINKEKASLPEDDVKVFYENVKLCEKGNLDACYEAQMLLAKYRRLYYLVYNGLTKVCKDDFNNKCKNKKSQPNKNCEKLRKNVDDLLTKLKPTDYDDDILPYLYKADLIKEMCRENENFEGNEKYKSLCEYIEKEQFLDEYYQDIKNSVEYLKYCNCIDGEYCPSVYLIAYGIVGLKDACKYHNSKKACDYLKNVCKDVTSEICKKDKILCKEVKENCFK